MPRKCCVPGCRSNYNSIKAKYVNVFSFPKDKGNQSKWIQKIRREDLKIGKETVVCIKHFQERFIIREHRVLRPDGTELVMPRKFPILTSNAYPSIFKEQPKNLPPMPPLKLQDPIKKLLIQKKQVEEKFMQCLDDDDIESFDSFNQNVTSRLPTPFVTINFKSSDSVCIVKCDISVFPKFPISIKVSNDLTVTVWENGNLISPLTLEWLFGKEQKCLNWSTFDRMLSYLNSYTSYLNGYASSSNVKSSAVLSSNDCISLCTNDIKQEKQ